MKDGEYTVRADAANQMLPNHAKRVAQKMKIKPYAGPLQGPPYGHYEGVVVPANQPVYEVTEAAMDARITAFAELLNDSPDYVHRIIREIRVKFKIFTPNDDLDEEQHARVETLYNGVLQLVAQAQILEKMPPPKADEGFMAQIKLALDMLAQEPEYKTPTR